MRHIPAEELAQKLTDAAKLVTVGDHYRHYREGEYEVIGLSLLEETQEVAVTYRNTANGLTWTRPLTSWLSPLQQNGQPTSRFTKI